jgi:membrane-bound lytic murein transglycosylase B
MTPRARWLAAVVMAATLAAAPAQALEVSDYPEIRRFVETMREQHQFSEKFLHAVFEQVRVRPEIVEAMDRPREALPYHEYRKQFLTDDRIRRGGEFWSRHAGILAHAEQRYGVAPEIIVAILGVETFYGRNTGQYPAADALTTLWLHYPRRAEFFRRELEELFLLARELNADPRAIKGSYAGAMGMPQFIASSYRRYAVDFDGDGRRDLLGNAHDVIGSVANFLHVHGWEPHGPVTDEVELRGTQFFWIERLGLKPALTVGGLNQYGIIPRGEVTTDRRAALVSLEDEAGPLYRLGYNNYYVITRYNRSKRYAMAVVELAERLRRQRDRP